MVFELRLLSPSFQLSEADSTSDCCGQENRVPSPCRPHLEGFQLLIPQEPGVRFIRDNRPVSIMNMAKKILTKILANWIQQHIKIICHGDFPGGPVVKNPPSNAGDGGSIPGRGTKIPHFAGQLSPCATTTGLTCLNKRATNYGAHAPWSPCATTKTWRSQKNKENK